MIAGIFRRASGCGLALLAGLAITLATPWAAQAQAPYPSRVVKLVVGFAAGGGNDIIARILAAKLQEELGGTFIVENKPGAGGRLAAENVMHAAPDGYTLLVGAAGAMTIIPAISEKPPYHGTKDFTPLSMVAGICASAMAPGFVSCRLWGARGLTAAPAVHRPGWRALSPELSTRR